MRGLDALRKVWGPAREWKLRDGGRNRSSIFLPPLPGERRVSFVSAERRRTSCDVSLRRFVPVSRPSSAEFLMTLRRPLSLSILFVEYPPSAHSTFEAFPNPTSKCLCVNHEGFSEQSLFRIRARVCFFRYCLPNSRVFPSIGPESSPERTENQFSWRPNIFQQTQEHK